jgi:hypothetical protein
MRQIHAARAEWPRAMRQSLQACAAVSAGTGDGTGVAHFHAKQQVG